MIGMPLKAARCGLLRPGDGETLRGHRHAEGAVAVQETRSAAGQDFDAKLYRNTGTFAARCRTKSPMSAT